jgi:hypothetical protein
VNDRGPTADRPQARAWAVFALLILAAIVVNPPFKIKVQITSSDSARGAMPPTEPGPHVASSQVAGGPRPETPGPTSPDGPRPAVIALQSATELSSATMPTVASVTNTVDPISPIVVDDSNGKQIPPTDQPPAPANLDPDIVLSAFDPAPNAAQTSTNPKADLAGQSPAATPVAVHGLSDASVDFSQLLSSSVQPVGPIFSDPASDENQRRSTPAQAASQFAEPALPPALSTPPTPVEALTVVAPNLQDTAPPGTSAPAQTASSAEASPNNNSRVDRSREDEQVQQTSCAACGGFHSNADGPALHDLMNCADGGCIPGRAACNGPSHESDSVLGAIMNNLYQCLCCPDPCYEPRWEPAANASFFADYARPRTVTRIRYDNLENLVRPDRNTFWLMQVTPTRTNNTKAITDLRARLQEVYIYQEAASARGSFFIEYGYRQLNTNYMPTQAGFSDLDFGIKSLFFDCELLQLTFQFRTYAPTGNAMLGLGTGHFSLDPSILATLKVGPETYIQGQFGNWIPIGTTSSVAGGMFYAFTSLNQVLWYPRPDSPLIGTLEMDAWAFENGGYTAAILPGGKAQTVEKGGGVSYFNIGPGLRQSICNRVDFGGAITWATSSVHFAQPWFRFEMRFLF